MFEVIATFLVAFGVGYAVGRLLRPSVPTCAVDYCRNRVDPRCEAALCSEHCTSTVRCDGRCRKTYHKRQKAERKARELAALDGMMGEP